MEADRWKKIEGLYQAAVALPPEKRAEYLAQACPGDPDEHMVDPVFDTGDCKTFPRLNRMREF